MVNGRKLLKIAKSAARVGAYKPNPRRVVALVCPSSAIVVVSDSGWPCTSSSSLSSPIVLFLMVGVGVVVVDGVVGELIP